MVGRIGPGWLPWVFGNCRMNGSLPKKAGLDVKALIHIDVEALTHMLLPG